MAASSAHSGRTSDCGGTSAGIVYVCRWELRRAYIYIRIYIYTYTIWPVGQGWGRRSARVAASIAHSGRSSDCGAAWVGIVYVCALVSHSLTVQAACHGGLSYEHRSARCARAVAWGCTRLALERSQAAMRHRAARLLLLLRACLLGRQLATHFV